MLSLSNTMGTALHKPCSCLLLKVLQDLGLAKVPRDFMSPSGSSLGIFRLLNPERAGKRATVPTEASVVATLLPVLSRSSLMGLSQGDHQRRP